MSGQIINKKIIIDLNGVIFEPIDAKFKEIAQAKYGRARGAAINMAYKYGVGRKFVMPEIETVFGECAQNPRVRDGALDALDAIVDVPGVKLEMCSNIAFPGQAKRLESQYRAMSPAMASAHYELISPFKSKRGYICDSTYQMPNAMNFLVDSNAKHLDWPSRWRIVPVLISNDIAAGNAARNQYGARVFDTLRDFHEYLMRRCR